MEDTKTEIISKVPQLTLLFWIMKIVATTLGETGGDAVSMSWLGETTAEANGFGYLIGTAIFGSIFALAVIVQIKAKAFHPFLYWFTIVATTTVGTTLADYCTRSLGIGYAGGSAILLSFLVASLLVWRGVMGTVSVQSIVTTKAEIFYWVTIMFSQTLGTALGDWAASEDGLNLGYLVSTEVFGGLLLIIVALYFGTKVSRVLLFWMAFILTRPLGAVVGDFLDKPVEAGGLGLSRLTISILLLAFITACILIFRPKAADETH